MQIDPSVLDLRIDGAWIREDSPIEYSAGFDAASARRIESAQAQMSMATAA